MAEILTLQQASETLANFQSAGRERLVDALKAYQIALEGKSPAQVSNIAQANAVQPEQIAGILSSTDDSELVDLSCKVLSFLLSALSFKDILSRFEPLILAGLDDPNPAVRKLSLSALQKGTESETTVSALVASPNFHALVDSVSFPDIDVAALATKISLKVAAYSEGLQALLDDTAVSILHQLLREDATVKFRVYELISQLCTISDTALGLCQRSGLLDSLVEELYVDDVLSVANTIELFKQLIRTDVGYSFLEQAKILQHLVGILQDDAHEDTSVVLTKCATMRFFGELAALEPAKFAEAQKGLDVLSLLDRQLQSPRQELKDAALQAIGNVGSNAEGLKLLDSQKTLLASFNEAYGTAAGSIRTSAMLSLSALLVGGYGSEDASGVAYKIYEGLGGKDELHRLIQYGKSAFDESRFAAYAVMKAIALLKWGPDEINSSSEFVNFITDRSLEKQPAGKEWRYAIIRATVQNPRAEQSLSTTTLSRFKRYVAEGPFYIEVTPVVAMQST
ncbi:26S proteasome non-ATPase regulatory subunit 5 [Rhizophlyctis rosea]|nr:26S proteasome non-ATPase regulatory subunit 5 [Rhizophlyctis rosea]